MRGGTELRLIARLMAHAVRHQPSIVPITALGTASSAAEVLAMISIIPLGLLAAGNTLPAHSPWHMIPAWLGRAADTKFFVVLFMSVFLFRMVSNVASLTLSARTSQMLFAHFASRAFAGFVRHLSFQD